MPPPALACHALTKTYHSTQPPTEVLTGIDLEVEEGEFVAIMGASGSGKSTLLYSLSGMDRPTTGQVCLAGADLTGLSDAEMSRVRLTKLGFVFQEAHFLANLTIGDNILLPALKADPVNKDAAIKRTLDLLDRFEIAHLRDHSVTEVSGGQLQRASICRALVCEPVVLFADEPTGALNSRMTAEVMASLSEIHHDGTTIVMVTHDPRCASRADRIIYLRDGSLLDSLVPGRWDAAAAEERVETLLEWLAGHGF